MNYMVRKDANHLALGTCLTMSVWLQKKGVNTAETGPLKFCKTVATRWNKHRYSVCASFKLYNRSRAFQLYQNATTWNSLANRKYSDFGDTGLKLHVTDLTLRTGADTILVDGTTRKIYIEQCSSCNPTGSAFLA